MTAVTLLQVEYRKMSHKGEKCYRPIIVVRKECSEAKRTGTPSTHFFRKETHHHHFIQIYVVRGFTVVFARSLKFNVGYKFAICFSVCLKFVLQ